MKPWLFQPLIVAALAESGYGSENSLKRHGSALSLASNTISTASNSSFKKGLVCCLKEKMGIIGLCSIPTLKALKEKLAEMETYKDILCNQMKTLQGYFDSCAETAANKSPGEVASDHALQAVDFKGEALTFRETTGAMLSNLQHCLDAVGQREEVWRRRLEREVDRRKVLEQAYLSSGKGKVQSPDQEYSLQNDLAINQSKKTQLNFSRRFEPIPNINDIIVEDKSKLLGLTIDKDLSWNEHIQILSKKLGSGIFAERRIKWIGGWTLQK
ncbi:Collagen type IV alpha-3-binding protein [Homalodisca vitripennis]|nr:Collagen type IV alpha-3-binding protein [Homalodisca vitripennis]